MNCISAISLHLSLNILTARPILTGVIATLIIAVLFFALLILRHSMVKKKAKAAIAACDQASPIVGVQAVPVCSTRPFPALIELVSPLSGKVIEDGASDRCAVLPSEGKVYAPCDGRIVSLSDGARSLTLETEGASATVTVCIGKTDTVLAEDVFLPCCKAGDKVKEGDLLLSFDLDLLDGAGYDLTALILVDEPERFAELTRTDEKKVSVGDHLMTLVPKNTANSPSQSQ